MDFNVARAHMIARQIRPWHVPARETLRALDAVKREDFVPKKYRARAFADMQIPLGDGEVMLEPKVGARMVELLRLAPGDRALNIGAGGGYLAAVLAAMCAQVTAVEINPRLLAAARRNLARAGLRNVTLEQADAHAGWGARRQFDAILVGGSIPALTDEFLAALNLGGRWVGIVGHAPAMEVIRVCKTAQGITRESLFDTRAPRLRNIDEPPRFRF